MAVYTKLEQSEILSILESYPALGKLQAFQEIAAGIENSNYFIDVLQQGESKRYVLTLFENLSATELPFFSSLTHYLSQSGLPVPAPIKNHVGETEFVCRDKPCVIVPCLPGCSMMKPTLSQCQALAEFVAAMHVAQKSFELKRELVRGLEWMLALKKELKVLKANPQDMDLLERSIERYGAYQSALMACPQGIVHGDLFRDNVLFEEDRVSGVIDFYHSCEATLLFDLAVAVNDWAWDEDLKDYNQATMNAMLGAYEQVRPLSDQEKEVWPRCLELAALRFWLSRMRSYYAPGYQSAASSGNPIKDPDEMKARLVAAQAL